MNNTEGTLQNIFTSIFNIPNESLIENFSINSTSEWDSMKQLTLITAIENEFDIFIEANEATNLTSYKEIIIFLNNHPEIN